MSRLMVVDDDPGVRETLRELVRLCCQDYHPVAEASNGLEAVELALALDPDVILMDIRMPILDGIQATRRIKQELKCRSVVITFTSYAWPELEREAREAGAAFHLRKPFALEELQKTLAEAAKLWAES